MDNLFDADDVVFCLCNLIYIVVEKEKLKMSEQLNFDQIIRNTNEGHLSCALLLDTSGSMDGAAIRNLNSAIKQFKTDVRNRRN